MNKDLVIKRHQDHLVQVLTSPRFLEKSGLGNEVPFFIYPFDPAVAFEMEDLVEQLVRRLAKDSVRALHINLYDLSIDILKKRGAWDKILAKELEVDKDRFLKILRRPLDAETHLIPAIAGRMRETPHDVILISGVGAVYPAIRSHTVLNNLQSTATEAPTVLFFPGSYTHSSETGANLNLFGRLPNNRYYRAFNLADFNA